MQAEERGEPFWEEEEVRPRQNRLQVWPELTILERRLFALFISGNGDSFLHGKPWNGHYVLYLVLEH